MLNTKFKRKEKPSYYINGDVSHLSLISRNSLARDPNSHLDIKVIRDVRDFDSLEQQWTALTEESDSLIFQTFQWNRIWWKYFGKEGDLNLVALYEGDKLAGIAPLFRDTLRLFGIPVYSCLRFLGSNVSQPEREEMLGLISYTDYLGIITSPGYEEAVLACISRYFHENRMNYDEIILDTVPETSPVWDFLIPQLKQNKMKFRIEECSSSQLVNVDRTWSEFLKSLNKNRRYNARLYLKRAKQKGYKVFDIKVAGNEEQVTKYFELLVGMHQKKWNKNGSLGTFYEKRNYDFHREITEVFHQKGWLQLKMAVPVDGKDACAAIDLNYIYKNRIYGAHTATDEESPYYKKGPGNVLLNTTIKEAMQKQTVTYDFLRGEEHYKFCMADKTVRNKRILIEHQARFKNGKARCIRRYIDIKRRLYRRRELWKLKIFSRSFFRGLPGME